jgi:hypothetical protein
MKTYNRPMRAKKRNSTIERPAFEKESELSGTAGQSGDLQGLSNEAEADSESVDELLEEGQAFEAEAIDAVENAPDADVAEVTTKELPEDDVPEEYRDKD